MEILHVVPSFFPAVAWGGPIFSTKAICDGLAADSDVSIFVLTTDAAGASTNDRVDESGQTIDFPEGYTVHYARRVALNSISFELLARLPRAISKADLVHLTGTYSFPTLPTLFFARIFGKPVIWSPRGALLATEEWPGAPNVNKKKLFERVAQFLRPERTVLLVTAQTEANASVQRLRDIRVEVVPNSVNVPKPSHFDFRRDGITRLMFLSRIHEKKGIERLFGAMQKLPNEFRLDVYGDGDPNYVRKIKTEAAKFGERVVFHGHVSGKEKARAFHEADLFVLPTYSENFGIVVAEALAHGTPVITTTQTPWMDLYKEGCGQCINLDRADLASSIAEIASGDLMEMGRRGRDWMVRDFSEYAIRAAIRRVYDGCLDDEFWRKSHT